MIVTVSLFSSAIRNRFYLILDKRLYYKTSKTVIKGKILFCNINFAFISWTENLKNFFPLKFFDKIVTIFCANYELSSYSLLTKVGETKSFI